MELSSFLVMGIHKHGENHRKVELAVRFHQKINFDGEDDCWLWIAGKNNTDYAAYSTGKEVCGSSVAHVFAWWWLKGSRPSDQQGLLDLDHLCRVRWCVNPKHLEPVTRQENLRRGAWARFAGDHPPTCTRGHSWTSENRVRNSAKYGWTRCRICLRDDQRRRRIAMKKAKKERG